MTSLTVRQLRELLEGRDDDTVVRVAIQPSWPLALEVDDEAPLVNGTLWLRATRAPREPVSPYAPREAFGSEDYDESAEPRCEMCGELAGGLYAVEEDGDEFPCCSSCAERHGLTVGARKGAA